MQGSVDLIKKEEAAEVKRSAWTKFINKNLTSTFVYLFFIEKKTTFKDLLLVLLVYMGPYVCARSPVCGCLWRGMC